ncbi:MAG TPA: hypothetical protein VFN23_20775 [Ktedonobacteraceae bacterium]|nr:hypothetical protein [Ktedonobacteraceae bacterium]
MPQAERTMLDELQYYFVIKQIKPDGRIYVYLSNYAPFRDDLITMPFDSEIDAALYLLKAAQSGAVVSSNDIDCAEAIIHRERPLFLFEDKQPDGTLVLSLHEDLPPEGSSAVVFGSRSPKRISRFLLKRLHESPRVHATDETIRKAKARLDE